MNAMTTLLDLDPTQASPTATEQSAVHLLVRLGRLGTRRKADTDQIDTDADKALLHLSKDILDSPELQAIARHDAGTRKFLQSRCLPSHLKSGVYLLPVTLIQAVNDALTNRRAERTALVDVFLRAYDGLKTKAQARLKSQFRDDDYPPIERVATSFGMRVRYLAFETPTTLKEINAGLFEQERQRAAAEWQVALEDAKALLRVNAKDLVDHLVDRLTPKDDGTPKIFRDSMIRNLREFLELFEDRNIAKDDQLSALLSQARETLALVSPDDLRDHEWVRTHVRTQFGLIKTQVDALVAETPRRSISFED